MKKGFVKDMSESLPYFMRVFGKRIMNVAPKDISHQHLVVIEMLKNKQVCQMKDVSEVLNVAMSTATALIDKMVENNYVKRAADIKDRRVVLITLTPKAQKLSKRVDELRSEIVKKVYSVLSDKEQDIFLSYIKKIVEHIDNENL